MYKFYYWGPLLFHTEINNENIKKIKLLCKKDKKKDFRKSLAGHIKQEFLIDNNKLINILKPNLEEYSLAYKNWYNKDLKSIEITRSWVNFMKKGEYNPPHIHMDCDLSCVLYLDIPKKLEEENKTYIGTAEEGGPGSISFIYGEHAKHVIQRVSFFPKNGDFFIFPNSLTHFVSPFISDIERVSVAANFNIVTDKLP